MFKYEHGPRKSNRVCYELYVKPTDPLYYVINLSTVGCSLVSLTFLIPSIFHRYADLALVFARFAYER